MLTLWSYKYKPITNTSIFKIGNLKNLNEITAKRLNNCSNISINKINNNINIKILLLKLLKPNNKRSAKINSCSKIRKCIIINQ